MLGDGRHIEAGIVILGDGIRGVARVKDESGFVNPWTRPKARLMNKMLLTASMVPMKTRSCLLFCRRDRNAVLFLGFPCSCDEIPAQAVVE